MTLPIARAFATFALAMGACRLCSAQVFTVGEKSATADIKTDFTATHVDLPSKPITERGRRELLRNLEAEQGFAHRVLPIGSVLTLQANGNMTPGPDAYKMMVYKKGQAAAPGDRVAISALEVKGKTILVDFNGGPYVRHRFLRHIQVGVGGVGTPEPDLTEQATGCRIVLVFEGGVPEVSAPEVKALLEPLIDFGVKTGDMAYADTLPTPVKSAIDSHEVLVGMNRRMVLAALGQPENKVREEAGGEKYEDWIYGHQPQTVRFVRFVGDRVSLIKVAAMGKPMEIHNQDELAGVLPSALIKTVSVGDADPAAEKSTPPTLMKAGETQEMPSGQAQRKVQLPDDRKPTPPATPPQQYLGSPSTL